MKINKKSWHYKAISKSGFTPSKSLCMYFWQIPLITLFFAGLLFIAFALFALLSNMVGFALSFFGLIGSDESWYLYSSGLGVAGFFISFVIAFVWACLSAIDFFAKRLKQPSLMREYISAKKQKICPILEFED